MDELAGGCRLIAPHHPGFGRSTGLDHLDDLHDLVVLYLDFLDTVGLESFDLIGESFGGMLAAELAAIAPRQVRRMVLVAPLGLWLDDTPVVDLFGLSQADLHAACWADPEGTTARAFAPNAGDEEEQKRGYLERMRSLGAAGKFLWPIPDRGLKKRIHRIAAPTLLLWGAEDRVVAPAYGGVFRETIRGAELVEVPAAGHFPMLERPKEALKEIIEFLDG
jgi:pimeloyl-ACP methyl ester carboxylesterase